MSHSISKTLRAVASLACLLILFGCASRQPVSSTPATAGSVGTPYSLPMGLAKIKVSELSAGPPPTYGVSFEGIEMIPDPSARYLMTLTPNSFATDHLVVNLTDNGLLDAVTLTTKDVSGEFVLKLFDLAGRLALAPPSEFLSFAAAGQPKDIYQAVFDPFDSASVNAVNTDLAARTAANPVTISIDGIPAPLVIAGVGSCSSSLCFRPPLAASLVVANQGVQFRHNIVIPDKQKIIGLDLERAALGETITKVDFENGMLKQFDLTHPSTGLAAVQLPLDVLKAIIALPTELIQLKIDTSGKNKALAEAQKAELEALKALIAAQAADP